MPAHGPDLVIRGGVVHDGYGGPARVADVAVVGDRIVAVGPGLPHGATEIDARERVVSPGFIDVHAHDDFALLVEPASVPKVSQGVTTDIVGNCGLGAAPFAAASWGFGPWVGDGLREVRPYEGYAGYLRRIDECGPALNVAVLVGHGTARMAVMGSTTSAPLREELRAMAGIVEEGMAAGAVGLSTGLIYEPGRHAGTDELVALARIAASAGGVYATHMRNEAARLLESVREALEVGERAGAAVQLSHHKASGRENWGLVQRSLRIVDQARARGLAVRSDVYPYVSGSTSLFAVVQANSLNERYAEGGIGQVAPDDLLIASCPARPRWEGLTLAALCTELDLEPEPAARAVLRVEPGTVVVFATMCEPDVEAVLRHPATMVGSDGVPAGSRPHPRLYGAFPRVLARYVRERGTLDLATAIHRMTGLPAAAFHLDGRGTIEVGAYADLVVFDPASVGDGATFLEPTLPPLGIDAVVVNGSIVVEHGCLTGSRPGRSLRRGEARTSKGEGLTWAPANEG